MPFGWGESKDAYQQVYEQGGGYEAPEEHKGKLSHELIAGGAAFEGFKLYEDKQRKEGKVVKYALAKEILAGFAAGEVDKLAETHGMNEFDKIEARHKAKKNAEQMYDDHYGGNADYDPSNDAPQDFQGRY